MQRDGRPHFCWLPVSLLLEDEREQFMRVEIAQNGSLEALALSEEGASNQVPLCLRTQRG